MELRWTPKALEDLHAAVDYIEYELGSPMAAEGFYVDVLNKAELFAQIPGVGSMLRTVTGVDTGYRYVICGNWMIFYRVQDGQVTVARILYGKSDYLRMLFGDASTEK